MLRHGRGEKEGEEGKIKKSAFIEERNVSSVPLMRAFVSPLGEINFPSSSVTLHPSTFLRTVEHVLEIFIRLTRSSWERRKLDGQWYIVPLWPIYSFAWINDKDTDKNFESNTDGNKSNFFFRISIKDGSKTWNLLEFGKIPNLKFRYC